MFLQNMFYYSEFTPIFLSHKIWLNLLKLVEMLYATCDKCRIKWT